VPVRSITSPAERRLWLDPRLLPRLVGRRVLLVDDVVSTGARRGRDSPAGGGGGGAGGDGGSRWPGRSLAKRVARTTPGARRLRHAIFTRAGDGWMPRPGSAPHDLCPLMPKDFAA
jgi:hypothetical protein